MRGSPAGTPLRTHRLWDGEPRGVFCNTTALGSKLPFFGFLSPLAQAMLLAQLCDGQVGGWGRSEDPLRSPTALGKRWGTVGPGHGFRGGRGVGGCNVAPLPACTQYLWVHPATTGAWEAETGMETPQESSQAAGAVGCGRGGTARARPCAGCISPRSPGDEKGRWGRPARPGSAASCYPRTPAKRE